MSQSNLEHIKPDFSKFDASKAEVMERATGPPAKLMIKQSGIETFKNPIVFDNACGEGVVGSLLHKLSIPGIEISCGDLEQRMVELMQIRAAKEGWNLKEAKPVNATGMDLKDESYTHVYTNFVVQMLGDKTPQAMSEIFRVLKPGGVNAFTSWQTVGWVPLVEAAVPAFKLPPIFSTPWTIPDQVEKEVAKAGFKNVKASTLDFEVEMNGAKAFAEMMAFTMPALFNDEARANLEKVTKEKYGEGNFTLPGWKATVVTAFKPE